MAFTTEGEKNVTIVGAETADCRDFDWCSKDPNAFDVVLTIRCDETGEQDVWRGEFSNDLGKGNASTRTQREMTMGTLEKVGFVGMDFSTLEDQLAGKKTTCTIVKKVDGKGVARFNINYLGGSAVAKIDKKTANQRFAALMASAPQTSGSGATTAATSPAVAAPAIPPMPKVTKSPFKT